MRKNSTWLLVKRTVSFKCTNFYLSFKTQKTSFYKSFTRPPACSKVKWPISDSSQRKGRDIFLTLKYLSNAKNLYPNINSDKYDS